MHLRFVFALSLLVLGIPALAADESLVYFGTYTSGESRGIYACRFEGASGKLTSLGLSAETENPSFLAIHPNGRYLYSVSELSGDGGETAGAVSAFAIDKRTGKLTLINKVSAGGDEPCHLNVDQTGRMLVVANYTSGNLAAFPLHDDASRGRTRTR